MRKWNLQFEMFILFIPFFLIFQTSAFRYHNNEKLPLFWKIFKLIIPTFIQANWFYLTIKLLSLIFWSIILFSFLFFLFWKKIGDKVSPIWFMNVFLKVFQSNLMIKILYILINYVKSNFMISFFFIIAKREIYDDLVYLLIVIIFWTNRPIFYSEHKINLFISYSYFDKFFM